MPSSRTVDRGDILHRAVDVFWRKGYGGTSVQDLVDALGLHRASLYDTFGSKEELFGEVVRHYSALMFETMFQPLGGLEPLPPGASPRARVDEFLGSAAQALCEADRRGCLVENALLAHGDELGRAREACMQHVARTEAKLSEVVSAGQERGEFRADIPPQELASVIRAGLSGMVFASLLERDPDNLRPIREGVLRALLP